MRRIGRGRLSVRVLCYFFCVLAPPSNVFHGVIGLLPSFNIGSGVTLVIFKRRLIDQFDMLFSGGDVRIYFRLRPSTSQIKAGKQYNKDQLILLGIFATHTFLVHQWLNVMRWLDIKRKKCNQPTVRLLDCLGEEGTRRSFYIEGGNRP